MRHENDMKDTLCLDQVAPRRLLVEGSGRCAGLRGGQRGARGRRASRPLPAAGLVLRFAPLRFAPVSIKCANSLLNI
ncbi:jg2928 [Pararge aegeria aegeria]|uniref:Jg2928 protein n=1 Tax=Pararge aegeria aegeria TaxID=348720 RepID=A0A8S4SDI0_9NEOP|nr:jg2928 [Pararge aegeria aegeria]